MSAMLLATVVAALSLYTARHREVSRPRGEARLARETRGLGAHALDLRDGLRRARGQHFAAVGRDQHVVLYAHADAAELLRDRVHDLPGLRLLLVLELLRRRHAEAVSVLPHLVLAVLAQPERRGLPLGVEVEARLHREHHARLEPP